MYEAIFPPEFKREYRRTIRTKYAGKALLITSEDLWIPWEMVRPYESDEDGQVLYDDPPLCEMFQVARWMAGRGAPEQVKIARGVVIAPPDNLQAARDEVDYLTDLHRRQWAADFGIGLDSSADVLDALSGGSAQLFHFVCHGNFDADDPNESKLKLSDGFLRPSQITGACAAGLRRSKPIVFLHASHSGRVGMAGAQPAGWAPRFLDAGASAFIGVRGEINDALASLFVREFYDRLFGIGAFAGQPQPLGHAFHEARMAVRQADPANPTWLAYTLWGNPNCQVTLSDEQQTLDP